MFQHELIFILFRDSDDEAEEKNKMVEIVNEVDQEEKQAPAEVSAENKAAQALDKVFAQEENSEEQMETSKDES